MRVLTHVDFVDVSTHMICKDLILHLAVCLRGDIVRQPKNVYVSCRMLQSIGVGPSEIIKFLTRLQSNSGLWIDDVRPSVNILVNLWV